MALELQKKLCLACNKQVKGRIDKKFCDDYCRNNYNNQQKSEVSNLVRNINNKLKKNRHILSQLLPDTEEMKKSTRATMLSKGFDFKYFTHTYSNKKGNTYFFCYEYGYLPLENDWFLLVKRNE